MRYIEETGSYNDRRYGRPWIARLDFSKNPGKPEYVFGDWLGSPGRSGELGIDVEAGDVIATGQKDHRKGRGGPNNIGVVQPDGTVTWNYTQAKARDAGKLVREQVAAAAAKSAEESAPEVDLVALGM